MEIVFRKLFAGVYENNSSRIQNILQKEVQRDREDKKLESSKHKNIMLVNRKRESFGCYL